MSFLFQEWNWDDALAVRFEEGMEQGREEGREEGWEQGRSDEKFEIARNALAKGLTPEFVQEITGLDLDTLMGLQGTTDRC